MTTKRRRRCSAASYLFLALFVGQQLMPDLIKQYPDVKWLATVGAFVAALYRAYDYFRLSKPPYSYGSKAQDPDEQEAKP